MHTPKMVLQQNQLNSMDLCILYNAIFFYKKTTKYLPSQTVNILFFRDSVFAIILHSVYDALFMPSYFKFIFLPSFCPLLPFFLHSCTFDVLLPLPSFCPHPAIFVCFMICYLCPLSAPFFFCHFACFM